MPITPPPSFTNSQLDMLMRAAKPLQESDRPAFLEAVARNLNGHTVGDGIVHRALAEAQREFLRSRTLDGSLRPSMSAPTPVEPVKAKRGPRYARETGWILRRGKRRTALTST